MIEISLILGLCLLLICMFEFINGFHDTANAVAPVIYTKALSAKKAVILAAIFNFLGVSLGGIGVAMGIIHLLPLELMADHGLAFSLCIIGSILISAIIWNFGTWYFGMPASSSHTLIGSILGVSLVLVYIQNEAVMMPWMKVMSTMEGLLISPIIGFFFAFGIMHILHLILEKKSFFRSPEEVKKKSVRPWTKYLLIGSSAFVSFAHGSNDGQKGVGLAMLIIISILPAHFAINPDIDRILLREHLTNLETSVVNIEHRTIPTETQEALRSIEKEAQMLVVLLDETSMKLDGNLELRRDILDIQDTSKIIGEKSPEILALINQDIKNISKAIDYVPWWVILMISLSLGLGTMVGWKRIVVTIGEKIGTSHLTYAQGVAASLVTALTISSASWLHLPVSTTHILSSGIAGTMAHEHGKRGLEGDTIKSILLAWIFTLPVATLLSGIIFSLLSAIFLY